MQQNTQKPRMSSLVGFTFHDWQRLLRDNHFSVSRNYWRRWMTVTLLSLRNSRLKGKEDERFGDKVAKAEVKPPIFVLGHWRSGTTLLHSLLTLDERFSYPNLFQVTFPHIFLSMAEEVERDMAQVQAEKRAMDNVQVTYTSPGEDESALAVLSLRSPTLSWMFPHREAFYDRYLTFHDVADDEVAEWKSAFVGYLKKLSCCHNRPLVLKSPSHTARVRLLLEMFPDARFVHVCRDPYQVFRSTRGLYNSTVANARVQTSNNDADDGILSRYRLMYDAYLEDRELIPAGHLHELRFEDLERDKLGQVKTIYERLDLGDFREVEPTLRSHVESLDSYQKNIAKPLPEDIRRQVAERWQRNFEVWGYER